MDFAVMGTISSYIKQKNLNFAAKYKLKTGQTLTNSNGNLISMSTSTFDKLREASKTSTDQIKQQKIRHIKQKLKSGQKLSDEEMGFLRVNDPKTYKKAKHAEEAREELKSELKRAKSKAEAQEALSRAMLKASSSAMAELGALGQGGSTCAGGSFGGNISIGGEMSAGGNISSGGEISSTGQIGGEVSGDSSNVQNFSEGQISPNNQSNGQNTSVNQFDAEKNSSTQKNSDADKFTAEDILEKYIWTIRALEDEWIHFTKTDTYKNLPNNLIDDEVKIRKPNRQQITATAAYRRAMM